MSDVFVSYSHDDRGRAEIVVDAFESAELTVDWDDHLRAGERFDRTIPTRIAGAAQVVVLWSSNSRCSKWVLREAEQAKNLGTIAPALLDECDPPDGFADVNAFQLAGITASDPRLNEFVRSVSESVREGSEATTRAGTDVRQAFEARNRGDYERASLRLENALSRFELDDLVKEDRDAARNYKEQTLRVLDSLAVNEFRGRSMRTLAGESLLPVIDAVLEVDLDVMRERGCNLRDQHAGETFARAGVVIRPGSGVDDDALVDKLLTESSSRRGPLSIDCFLLIMRTNDSGRGGEFTARATLRGLNAECVIWQPIDGDDRLRDRLSATSQHLCEVPTSSAS